MWTILRCGAFAPFLETKNFTFEINGKKWPTRPFESLLLCSTEEIMSNRFETSWGWESTFSFLDELIHTYSMFYCIYFLLFPTGYFPLTPLFSVWAWVCTKQCLFPYHYLMIPPCSHGSSEAQSKPYYSDYSPTRLFIHKMCTSNYLDLFITIVIGLNVITMSMEHYHQPKVLLGMPVVRECMHLLIFV